MGVEDHRGEEPEHCAICGEIFEDGITIWPYPDVRYPTSYAHPECVEGKRLGKHIPIDHGD